jgi:hypothetical protein
MTLPPVFSSQGAKVSTDSVVKVGYNPTGRDTYEEVVVMDKEKEDQKYEKMVDKFIKGQVCPFCGSKKVAYVVYGLYTLGSSMDRLIGEKVTLGGCCVMTNEDGHEESLECLKCSKRFPRVGKSPAKKTSKKAEKIPEDAGIPPEKFGEVVDQLAKDSGTPKEEILKDFTDTRQRIFDMMTSPNGKYQVIHFDRFDWTEDVYGEYDTAEEALKVARERSLAGMIASHEAIADIYCAYDPKGNYLGGNTWRGE